MDQHQRTQRFGAAVIAWALVLRLYAAGALETVVTWLTQPNITAFVTYLETGRYVRFSASQGVFLEFSPESAAPFLPTEAARPVFAPEDTSLTDLYYACDLRPDIQTLLEEPLDWDLADGKPAVLILHTHTTESYTQLHENYVETSDYRTLDEGYNMLSIGQRVQEILEENGIVVIQDRQLHDYPSYNGSYTDARKSIRQFLAENPTIRLVLDLHRDASGDPDNQLRTLAEVEGQTSAQLMLVIGTNSSGLSHPDWEENMALGVKLHAQLERLAPGITRPIVLRSQRFNQDLSPGALLIEVGAAGNSHQEAITAARVLAQAIGALSLGAKGE